MIFVTLQNAGFTHSAFTFGYESFVHKTDINSNDVPPGALVSFVQKGLQYLEMEANLANEVRLVLPRDLHATCFQPVCAVYCFQHSPSVCSYTCLTSCCRRHRGRTLTPTTRR